MTTGLELHYLTSIDYAYTGVSDTTTVETATRSSVSARTLTVGTGTDKTYDWSCTDDGYCPDGAAAFQFWVDPSDPLGSVRGQGLPYEYLGISSLPDPETHQSYRVGILHYANADGTVKNSTFFEVGTGLVIESDAVADGVVTQLWYVSTTSP